MKIRLLLASLAAVLFAAGLHAQPAETVRNLIRAVTQPYPGAFTYAGKHKVLIWEASVDPKAKGWPGTILSMAPLTIACGEGAIIVKAGQEEGGLYLSGRQLPQELGLKAGMTLGVAMRPAAHG